MNDLGSAARERGDFEAAIDYYREALQSSPADEATRRNLGHAQNELAIRLGERGDYAGAVSLLEAAIQNRPDDDVVRQNLAAYRATISRQHEEAERQKQLDRSKRVIGGMLNDLAEEFGTSSSPNSSGASGGLNFADSGGAEVASNGLSFMTPGMQTTSPANQDTSVVDLTFMDPNKPMVVDPRTVEGEAAARGPTPLQTAELRDAVRSAEATGGNRKTEILLDALEVGNTDWTLSLSYLEEARHRFPGDLAIRDALATLMGINATFGLDGGSVFPNFGSDMLGSFGDIAGLDYETHALLQRAAAKFSTAMTSSDWEVVHRLFAQAHERMPHQLRIRDWANYSEGTVIGLQHFE